MSDDAARPAPDRVIAGRYRVLDRLGQGGMGAVWLAEDQVLGRRVALKELRIPPTDSPQQRDQLRDRLVREARAAARLHHPGAVTVHDVVDDHGLPCVVMELLDGRPLDQGVGAQRGGPGARAGQLRRRLTAGVPAPGEPAQVASGGT